MDLESSAIGTYAEWRIYKAGVLVDSGIFDFSPGDGNGDRNFFGYSVFDSADFFDQVLIVVGDDNAGGSGNREQFAADCFIFGQAYAESNAGFDYETTFTEDGPAVSIADTDALITDVDDTHIESATIVLTNAMTDDVLNVGALPVGVSSSINTSVPGQITVTLTGSATKADYASFIKGITFENTSNDPATTDRIINVTVNDGDANSNTAQTTIHIVPVNDPPTANDDSFTTFEGTPTGIEVLNNDSDSDGDTFNITEIDGNAISPRRITGGYEWNGHTEHGRNRHVHSRRGIQRPDFVHVHNRRRQGRVEYCHGFGYGRVGQLPTVRVTG